MQKTCIKMDNNKGKSKFLAGKTGNTIGRTIRFITIHTKMPYANPEIMVFVFKKGING